MTGGAAGAIPLVIDTDTAQDDCVALLIGLLDPRADLKAITMVAGNVDFGQQVHNAHITLAAAGRLGAVPIHLGCREPLVREWVSAENVHGDGSGGLRLDEEGLEVSDEHGVDALVRLAAEHRGELRIVAIGPLTNIASALTKDPDFARNVGELYIMGGSNNGRGNITAAAEYNFFVDPEAAKAVFAAGFDITVIPWDPLTLRDGVFSRGRLAEIAGIGTPLSRFFTTIVQATLEFDESVGIPGSTHPDSLTAAVLLHPELIAQASPYAVDVEADSELTRGYSAMSWGVHGLTPNARVVERVHGDEFFAYITRLLSDPVEPSRTIAGL
ncbi:MAG: nucleoside hydrolase [Microbacterium sp.]